MNRRHLAVTVVAVLALSSSTIASAEGGSHRRMGEYNHIDSVLAIGLSNYGGILRIDTSTANPSFLFDTTTVTPHIDFDPSRLITHLDTSTATSNFDDELGISDDGEGGDDSLPVGLNTPGVPPGPSSPATPGIPSWVKEPQAKSNDDGEHSDQSSAESQD